MSLGYVQKLEKGVFWPKNVPKKNVLSRPKVHLTSSKLKIVLIYKCSGGCTPHLLDGGANKTSLVLSKFVLVDKILWHDA